ncbi:MULTISPECIES: DNA polymerase III subunit beta [Bacillus]|uniref:DNA polymerase III subunit beta n=1 Tax=Bacillus TaxID=1386 RepID=UPI00159BCDAD|nr:MULTISPECIES: DNA polymerase III subunit beta [Bacillus]
MKFNIDRTLFISKLEKAANIINPKHSIPIMQGVLLEVRPEGMLLTGTNGTETISIYTQFNGDIGECEVAGKAVFAPGPILKIIKKYRGPVLTIEVNKENEQLVFKENEKKSFSFLTLEVEEFPNLTFEQGKVLGHLPSGALSTIGEQTLHAVSASETRPVLTGVNFIVTNDKLTCIATDSFRLSKSTYPVTNSSIKEEAKFVVPAPSLKNAIRICEDQDTVKLMATETQLIVRGGSVVYQTRLLEGAYPDTNRLIPSSYDSKVSILKEDLLNTIEQIQFISETVLMESKDLFFSCTPGKKEVGNAQIDLTADMEGDINVMCNARYLIDAIKTVHSPEIVIDFTLRNNAPGPFVLKGSNEDDKLQLILPVRM